jgi:peptide/nickel transport system substrate-binding protein
MKRSRIVLSILVAMAMLLAACGQATEVPPEPVETEEAAPPEPTVAPPEEPTEVVFERGETLYVSGAAWSAIDLNPFQPGNLTNTTGTIDLSIVLFAFDPMTGEMTPWLAESGEWTDATTYDLTLREGLTWSDGEPLTAADVVFTFELGQQYAALWFSNVWVYLTGVTAVDDTHCNSSSPTPSTRNGRTISTISRSCRSISGPAPRGHHHRGHETDGPGAYRMSHTAKTERG